MIAWKKQEVSLMFLKVLCDILRFLTKFLQRLLTKTAIEIKEDNMTSLDYLVNDQFSSKNLYYLINTTLIYHIELVLLMRLLRTAYCLWFIQYILNNFNSFQLYSSSWKVEMKTFLVLILLAYTSQCYGQKKFIVDVIDFTMPNFNTSSFRCYGTIISAQHVLVPASCVNLKISGRTFGIQARAISATRNETTYGENRQTNKDIWE